MTSKRIKTIPFGTAHTYKGGGGGLVVLVNVVVWSTLI